MKILGWILMALGGMALLGGNNKCYQWGFR